MTSHSVDTTKHVVSSKPARPAFTLVELLVVIAIIGILIGLLLPAVQAVRRSGRAADCQSRLANIGKGFLNYETTGFGKPKPGSWQVDIGPHIENNESVFVCPSLGIGETVSYGMNNLGHWMGAGDSAKVMIAESPSATIDVEGGACDAALFDGTLADRHMDMLNVLFVDGSVDRRAIEDFDPVDAGLLAEFWWPKLKPAATCP